MKVDNTAGQLLPCLILMELVRITQKEIALEHLLPTFAHQVVSVYNISMAQDTHPLLSVLTTVCGTCAISL